MVQSGMDKARQGVHPRNPKDRDDFEQLILNGNDEYKKNFQGMITDQTTGVKVGVMFANPILLLVLKAALMIAFDGTFYVVPSEWYQCFTIFFVWDNHFFPGICILLSGKSESVYDSVWTALKTLLGDDFNPTEGMSDFEIASRKTAHRKFNIVVKGCYFHYTRAVSKNLLKIGLGKSYASYPAFKRWARLVLAIPLLPADDIREMFDQLLLEHVPFTKTGDRILFARFKKYLRSTWRNIRTWTALLGLPLNAICNLAPSSKIIK